MKKKLSKSSIFPKKISVGKRNWGTEDLLVLIPNLLTLKKIVLKKGKKGGLQYHHKKNECGFLISGKLLIRYDLGDGKLKKKIIKSGNSFHFPPGMVHQEEALENCEIIEASSSHFNDRVRVENKYGLKVEKGLPSTKKSDVIKK